MSRRITSEEFEELYRQTAADLFTYVRRRTSSDAEDLVAETYLVAWRRRGDLPAPVFRRAWLFGVARTLLQAHLREQRSRRSGPHPDAAVDVEVSASSDVPTRAEGSTVRARTVVEALDRLSPADREILRLVAWEGLTPAELAVALDVRPGTARVRLHRARQALARDTAVIALFGSAADPPAMSRSGKA